MNTAAEKKRAEGKPQQTQGLSGSARTSIADSRAEKVAQTKRQALADNSGSTLALQRLQRMFRNPSAISSGAPDSVAQRAIIATDVEAANIVPAELERVLAVINTYEEDAVREKLADICMIFSTVTDWPNYTEEDIRAIIDAALEPVEQGEPLFTMNDGAMNNPWLHVLWTDYEAASQNPRLLIDDSDYVEGYMAVSQTCSVMAIHWMINSQIAGHYTIRQAPGPEALARILYANQTPVSQFQWAAATTGMAVVDHAPSVEELRQLGVGRRVLLYSDIHVSACIIRDNDFLYYDPETGSAEATSDQVMTLYLGATQQYLHS